MPEIIPFGATAGPKDAKTVIIGEVWGETEAKTGIPFMGRGGQFLTALLKDAGIDRRECLLTTVIEDQPPDIKMDAWLVGSKEPSVPNMPQVRRGKYLAESFAPHLDRLAAEIAFAPRNLIIALGNLSAWAVLGTSGIMSIRGVCAPGQTYIAEGIKVLPTFHPSGILRSWDQQVIARADLKKASREREFPEIRCPRRFALVNPTFTEVLDFAAEEYPILSVDIETANRAITHIGFAPSTDKAICIPFVADNEIGSYWPTHEQEVAIWRAVERLLLQPCPKVFQNGMYDLQYLYRMGLKPKNCLYDTMLHHHALFSELPKSLGFMGSIYTNERSWKLARTRKNEEKPNE